jgi:hypothetical protein
MRLLELSGPASLEQIKQAYHRLAHRLHPDKNDNSEAARQRFTLVSEAYRTLIHAAHAVQQGREVGLCARCGRFGELVRARDGSPLCLRCILAPGSGRLLPMPILVVARCLTTIVLILLAGYLLYQALAAETRDRIMLWSAAASLAGLLSLLALARTCLTVVHCISDRERRLHRSYRNAESRERTLHRSHEQHST